MLDISLVKEGIFASGQLSTRMIMDEAGPTGFMGSGQVEGDAAGTADAAETADYIVGLIQAVGANLQAVGVGLQNYRETRYQQDGDISMRMRNEGTPFPNVSNSKYDERELRLDVYERSLYISMGSVLDCLAGAVIGISGLNVNIHRADFGLFQPIDEINASPTSPKLRILFKSLLLNNDVGRAEQLKTVQAFGSALVQSGPTGWTDWTLGMRNMSVHREHRNELISIGRERTKHTVHRLPVANPGLSNLQGIRQTSERLSGYHLTEDIQTTLDGIVGSLNAASAATMGAMETLWERRKRDPALISQPLGQWKLAHPVMTFRGYAPGSVKIDPGRLQLMMNPLDARRLQAGGLIQH
ncbi:hypothetical protein QN345_03535 [Cryobacterium sp. 10I1]|uniref:hypothetical protein n=1 Tax=unclassified Cryobacterium TaxID=2649013 RepID=UPI002AB466A5|nr:MULTISPECIES: hypothetical protein [unclassified Cryobacterium]MDY7540864.1 hypothetical protein [Cryobacterium sp. 5B3]MEA9999828.1 hypothetical protein [Cryobacterium sp. RTS3]MEB0003841.1 hypothetical protein [Cryobacterium sp. RTC2.1]MEB0201286.1 hypothetical protein [Cryobacterium sp. 5I3]MEB0266615.1 hypothetical protein [Cryobacterium sp. 10I5]